MTEFTESEFYKLAQAAGYLAKHPAAIGPSPAWYQNLAEALDSAARQSKELETLKEAASRAAKDISEADE